MRPIKAFLESSIGRLSFVLLIAGALAWGSPLEAQEACSDGEDRLCLAQGRFKVEVSWQDSSGNSGSAYAVTAPSDDSGLFWFFNENNWEMMVKVLDGCAVNDRFWVFAAATTDVRYTLRVTDSVTGYVKTYENASGNAAEAITDSDALPVCSSPAAAGAGGRPLQKSATVPSLPTKVEGSCVASDSVMCLGNGRFRVEVDWRDFQNRTGSGNVVPFGSQDSGLFWFFQESNWEMLVKVLDGCSQNGHFWVFGAATTNVEYTLKVTDTETGLTRSYFNPLGTSAPAITDTSALSCDGDLGLPPDPGEEGQATLEGIDSDNDGLRDDLQRHIVFEHGAEPAVVEALRQGVVPLQDALMDAGSSTLAFEHANAMDRALECLSWLRPDDGADIYSELLAEAVNTEARLEAYLAHDEQLEGNIFALRSPTDWAASCDFDLSAFGITPPEPKNADSCLGSSTTVVYGNGILSTRGNAISSLGTISAALQSELSAEEFEKLSFELAYNPTQGIIQDLWESVKQRLESDVRAFLRYLAAIDEMPQFLQDEILDLASSTNWNVVGDEATLQTHVDRYRARILEGSKVVLVAHSQGNLFANRAWLRLTADERRSFGIVSVANPDSSVAGGGPYTTLLEDLVILAIPGSMSSNTTNFGVPLFFDPLGHNFIRAYMLRFSLSRPRILGHIESTINSLVQPTPEAGEGIITVTLTWGDEPDVDLHAFEPNGTHVYYANRTGQSGYLDVDDVTSFGPEHYFVACDTLETGRYRIGVNYYRGSGPEVARVQIQAGLLVRSFQIPLNQAVGSSGNSNPIPVGDIVVTGDAQSGYAFQIP